jgi:hypothetical protein
LLSQDVLNPVITANIINIVPGITITITRNLP